MVWCSVMLEKFNNLNVVLFRLEDMIPVQQFSLQRVNKFQFKIITELQYKKLSGRLYQVEYAMEAISHAGTCLGILANDGILLAAERRNTNKLLDEVFSSEKIYKLNE